MFRLVGRETSDVVIEHYDIHSMYPFIAMQHKFICGPGIRLIGPMVSRLSLDYKQKCFVYTDPDTQERLPCDGAIQVVIGLDKDHHAVNRLPFLPIRLKEGYQKQGLHSYRASCLKCLLKKQKSLCHHTNEERRFRQTYTMNEVAYAVTELSYTLYAIEEALCYVRLEPMFADYFKLLASQKIRFSAVPAEHKEDLTAYCETINNEMGFDTVEDRLTPSILTENPYQCAYVKSLLNQSIGKLSQTTLKPSVEFVHHEHRLSELFGDVTIDIISCFLVTPNTMQVTYQKKDSCLKVNRWAQCVLNSCITLYARQYLNWALRDLERARAELLYVDTNGVLFLHKRGAPLPLKCHSSLFGA